MTWNKENRLVARPRRDDQTGAGWPILRIQTSWNQYWSSVKLPVNRCILPYLKYPKIFKSNEKFFSGCAYCPIVVLSPFLFLFRLFFGKGKPSKIEACHAGANAEMLLHVNCFSRKTIWFMLVKVLYVNSFIYKL